MFDKILQAQQKMQEVKDRLDSIQVFGEAENGKVKVTMTATKRVVEIYWDEELNNDKEALQDLLVIAMNRGMEQADNVSNSEMQAVAGQIMPGGLGGLGKLFGQ